MVRKLQPACSFKSIEGTFARDPVRRLGKLATISPDGQHVFSICDAGGTNPLRHESVPSAAVYNMEGQAVSSKTFSSLVNSGTLSGNASVAVAGTEDGNLHLWSTTTGAQSTRAVEHSNAFCDVAISPGGDTMASTCFRDDAVRTWDAAGMRCSHAFHSVFEKRARSGLCNIQADGRRVFVCDHREIHVLDLKMQHKAFSVGNCKMNSLGGLGTFMSAFDVDRDGRKVAAVHWPRNQVCVWDMRARKIEKVIRLKGNQGTGTVSLTPDGSRIICSAYPPEENLRMAAICDLGSGKITHRLNHSDARTISTSISADGTRAVSLSKDGVARIYFINAKPTEVKQATDIDPTPTSKKKT